ncbi:MAG: cbb3-type cytochrome c oxidase subunit I [Armatimonadota bacterium]|nr:cbb3-type cytochrome c oxidase subunit I [Armatimonadota bacterium]
MLRDPLFVPKHTKGRPMPEGRFWEKEYSSARVWLAGGAVWMAIGTLAGLGSAIHLVAPDFFANIPWLEFGRIRQVHVNTVLFGFVVQMLIGCALYIMPRVLATKLFSEPLANLAALFFNAGVVLGDIGLMAGYTQGREYAEYIFPADVLLVIALVMVAVNMVMTLVRRNEQLLYVSSWYFAGAIVWTVFMYPLGNVMWHPATGAETGITDAIFLWFYGHNVFGLLVTPLAVGIAYYMFPRIAGAPLYSQALSIIGFWSLLLFYTHIGAHHLIQAPIPTWLKTVSIIDSFAMMLPVATVLVNQWYTARGRFGRFLTNPSAKLMLVGTIWYAIVCIQGPLQSLAVVQRVTHFNNWVVGHAHIAVLGFTGFIALGGMYYVLPYVTGRRVYSEKLINIQYWLILLGLLDFFIVLTIAGLIQGQDWLNGATVYRTVPQMKPYMTLRLAGGLMIITGAFVGVYNVLMTFRKGEPINP